MAPMKCGDKLAARGSLFVVTRIYRHSQYAPGPYPDGHLIPGPALFVANSPKAQTGGVCDDYFWDGGVWASRMRRAAKCA